MNIIEIIKTFAPLIVSILVVILNHLFSLSKSEKEIENQTKQEDQKERKLKAYELTSALLSFKRLDQVFINKISMSLFTNLKLPPEDEKDLQLGQRELSNELLKIRAIVFFYFPEIISKSEKIEEIHDKNIIEFLGKRDCVVVNKEFANKLQSRSEELHITILDIIYFLREKYNA